MQRILAATALTLVACTGWADDGQHEGRPHTHWWLELAGPELSWYAGAGFGQSRFDGYELYNDGSFTSQSADDGGTALRVLGGLAIGRYLALELGYSDFGEASSRAQSDGMGPTWNAGPQVVKIKADGYDLSVLGRLRLAEDWALFGKVGATMWETDARVALDAQCCGVIRRTFSDDDTELTYGGGVHYDGLRPVRIIGEYGVLPFDIDFFADDGTLDWVAISVAYLF